MKLEMSEKILVETLVSSSIQNKKIPETDNFEIEKLTGDASTRRYYRISFEKKNYVVCVDAPKAIEEGVPDFVSVQSVLEAKGIRVPRIYDLDVAKGYYLEEDLGDQTFLMSLGECENRKEEYQWYEKAVGLLVQLHEVDLTRNDGSVFAKRSFDTEKLMFEINFTVQHFIEGLMGHKRESYDHNFLINDFKKIIDQLVEGPWVFTHRDYHSRNIMVKEDELIVIDFQDARKGLPQYDLASLIEDCYYELSTDNHEKLMKLYWSSIGHKIYNDDYELFMKHYHLMAIQRIYKAIGSFSYIYRLRGDIRYLRHIGRAFERLKAILFEVPEHSKLRQLLCELYYAY